MYNDGWTDSFQTEKEMERTPFVLGWQGFQMVLKQSCKLTESPLSLSIAVQNVGTFHQVTLIISHIKVSPNFDLSAGRLLRPEPDLFLCGQAVWCGVMPAMSKI
jgi:hypothetical protein